MTELAPEVVEWARKQGYLFCAGQDDSFDGLGDPCPPEGCGWVDHDDNPVDVQALYDEEHEPKLTSATWKKTQRRETSLIEHVCEHGVGHPNFYSVVRLSGYSTDPEDWGYAIHGCDGCCQADNFPGRRQANWELMLRPYAAYIAVASPKLMTVPALADDEWGLEFELSDLGTWIQYTFHDICINDMLDGKVLKPPGQDGRDFMADRFAEYRDRYPTLEILYTDEEDLI